MATLYVARSQNLQQWGSDVGLTPHLYKVGVTTESAEAAIESLNAQKFGGEADWQLVKAQPVDADEPAILERIGRKEKFVDPTYYPRLGGVAGIVKVKVGNVQNRLMVRRMMAGEDEKPVKPKPADIADHLVQDATGEG